MINEHSSGFGIILTIIITICFISTINAEEVTDSKGSISSSTPVKVKRAWSQMAPGWGKRAENDLNEEAAFNELLHKMFLKYYADKINDEESDFNSDYDNGIDKRAWSQMAGTGWGKRDWRGYGKRREWSKLQSAWGKK
ncbi:hypothetical protein PVAND_001659 [Polypedilum vanderplanki]|uniref:Uncharacterized protein n=1 Tax=Polypedilum vanderplanki TaxID=319348 RepID=A0A9J6BP23_POLVA|nr:hypothetical protein PVAND_001659 [Polypedilum vanderplanki]